MPLDIIAAVFTAESGFFAAARLRQYLDGAPEPPWPQTTHRHRSGGSARGCTARVHRREIMALAWVQRLGSDRCPRGLHGVRTPVTTR
jgi:hypothetical protein